MKGRHLIINNYHRKGLPRCPVVKNPPANAGDIRDGFNPWVGKIPWSRKWQPTPVCLPGESHGQRSLVGYSSWGCKESDMTERLTLIHTVRTQHNPDTSSRELSYVGQDHQWHPSTQPGSSYRNHPLWPLRVSKGGSN